MSFSFLHSMDSNVALFSNVLDASELEPDAHHVRSDLLEKVTKRGEIDGELANEIEQAISDAAKGEDLVLLTCSSLSPIADRMKSQGFAVERTDGLLARAIFEDAKSLGDRARIAVLVVAPTTVVPTGQLFERCRQEAGATSIEMDVILLPEVWDLFLGGDLEAYRAALGRAIDHFLQDSAGITHVALGQASMAPALETCSSSRAKDVWTVPGATRDHLLERYK